MNEYRALVEWQWQGKIEVLGEKSDLEPFLTTIYPTCNALGMNTGLRYERPKTKRWATTWPWQTVSGLLPPRPRHSFSSTETNELLIRDFTLPTRCSSKSSLLWVVTQGWLVAVYRSCKKVYRSLLKLNLWRWHFVGPRRLIHWDE